MSGSDAVAKAAARHRARLTKILSAAKHHLSDQDVFSVLGKNRSWAEIRAMFEQMLVPYQQRDQVLTKARAEAGQLLLTIRRNVGTNAAHLAAFGESLTGRLGRGHPLLKEFGVSKGKRQKPSAETMTRAVAARNATRAAGGSRRKRRRRG